MSGWTHLRTDGATRVLSPLTGNAIWVSPDMERAFSPPDADLDAALRAYESIRQCPAIRRYCAALGIPEGPRTMCEVRMLLDRMLERLVERGQRREFGGRRAAIVNIHRFVLAGTVSLPVRFSKHYHLICEEQHRSERGHFGPWTDRLVDAAAHPVEKKRELLRMRLIRIAISSIGIRGIGDLTVETVSPGVRTARRFGCGFPRCLTEAQRRDFGQDACERLLPWQASDERFFAGVDPAYRWVTEKHPELEGWRQAWADWVERATSPNRPQVAGRAFLKYLIANPAIARTPEAFCARDYANPVTYLDWVSAHQKTPASTVNGVHRMLNDWLDRQAVPDDKGHYSRRVDLINPVPRISTEFLLCTTREAIASKYMRELVEILTEDNYAFSRRLGIDDFSWLNPATGACERLWSPVRTYALLLMMLIPLRSFQTRMLESDEGDPERWVDGKWVPVQNSVHANCRGFIRKMKGANGRPHSIGFFVNTNKTQDLRKAPAKRGYVIPWERADVLQLAMELQTWQKIYNPLKRPTRWLDVKCHSVQRRGKKLLTALGQATFLFRNPCSRRPDQPIGRDDIAHLWTQLLAELERRVAARGERYLDETKVQFVNRLREASGSKVRTRLMPRFSLHSLRVSLITHLVIDAGIPPEIVARYIAGHATPAQSLYYVKLCTSRMEDILERGRALIGQREAENFELFREEQRLRSASTIAALSDPFASSVQAGLPEGWQVRPTGLCLVGTKRCSEVEQQLRAEEHLVALTEAHPCVRCPFHVSGPAFLSAVISDANRWSEKQSACAVRLARAEAALSRAEDRCIGDGADLKRLSEANASRSWLAAELEAAHTFWAGSMALAERCRQFESFPDDRLTLVAVGTHGDVRAALTQTEPTERLQAFVKKAHWACRTDAFPESPPLSQLMASLERGKLVPLATGLQSAEAHAMGVQIGYLLAPLDLPEGLPSPHRSPQVSPDLTEPLIEWAKSATLELLPEVALSHPNSKPRRTPPRRLLPPPNFSA